MRFFKTILIVTRIVTAGQCRFVRNVRFYRECKNRFQPSHLRLVKHSTGNDWQTLVYVSQPSILFKRFVYVYTYVQVASGTFNNNNTISTLWSCLDVGQFHGLSPNHYRVSGTDLTVGGNTSIQRSYTHNVSYCTHDIIIIPRTAERLPRFLSVYYYFCSTRLRYRGFFSFFLSPSPDELTSSFFFCQRVTFCFVSFLLFFFSPDVPQNNTDRRAVNDTEPEVLHRCRHRRIRV